MTALAVPAVPRAHWTNYDVTYRYGASRTSYRACVKITEGRETLADLPRLIAQTYCNDHPDLDQIAVMRIEVACDSRAGKPLVLWLREIANAATVGRLREVAYQAQLSRVIGPQARRPAEASIFADHMRKREAELAARVPHPAA